MSKNPHRYRGEAAEVSWDERLCLHISECSQAEGELFVLGRRPWCRPDLVQLGEIRDVVERCPTGAICYQAKTGSQEEPDASNTVTVVNDGPLYLRGDLEIDGAEEDMPGVRFRAALCRCGKSQRKPFCDNAHQKEGFRDAGAVGEKGKPIASAGGKLRIARTPNGPLQVSGNFTIVAATGRKAWTGTTATLCRCGQSQSKPFCDGSHERVHFEAD